MSQRGMRRPRLGQVQLAELDHAAELVVDLPLGARRARSTCTSSARRQAAVDLELGVAARLRACARTSLREVGREDAHLPARRARGSARGAASRCCTAPARSSRPRTRCRAAASASRASISSGRTCLAQRLERVDVAEEATSRWWSSPRRPCAAGLPVRVGAQPRDELARATRRPTSRATGDEPRLDEVLLAGSSTIAEPLADELADVVEVGCVERHGHASLRLAARDASP